MGFSSSRHVSARWVAVGVAVAAATGAIGIARADISAGDRAAYVPIVPCRLFDTRADDNNVGDRKTPLGPADVFTQTVHGTHGRCTIPTDATAIALNVTVVNPTADSFLTFWPADAPRPLAANLNWRAGAPPTPNKVDVKLSADGKVSVFNLAGNVDVVADAVGYYANHNHDDRYYSKGQTYTKAEVDDRSYTKEQTYTKTEVDSRSYTKEQTYTKSEVDAALAGKAARPTGATTLLVDASAFTPAADSSDGTGMRRDFSGYITGQSSVVAACADANLSLPNGATITQISAHVSDISGVPAYNALIQLFENPQGPSSTVNIAQAETSGVPGATTIIDATIQNPVIDSVNKGYFFRVCGLVSAATVLFDAAVTYLNP